MSAPVYSFPWYLLSSVFLIIAILVVIKWYLFTCSLFYISLINDAEHLFNVYVGLS